MALADGVVVQPSMAAWPPCLTVVWVRIRMWAAAVAGLVLVWLRQRSGDPVEEMMTSSREGSGGPDEAMAGGNKGAADWCTWVSGCG